MLFSEILRIFAAYNYRNHMGDDKKHIVDENVDIVSEPTMEAVCVEPAEHTHEYELLEIQALKILAKRAMQQYQNGECISSEQAMQHFKRFIV